MKHYEPDNWIVIKLHRNEFLTYKILAGWEDRWRLSPGITGVEKTNRGFKFVTDDCCFVCGEDDYAINASTYFPVNDMIAHHKEHVTVLPQHTDWAALVPTPE